MFQSKLILIHVGEESLEKEDEFKTILDPFIKQGLRFEIVFKPGNPVDVILSISEEKQIDLIILGALKRENFLKYYVGSIARKITRLSKCSVLLLIKPSVDRIPCQHIVVNGLKDIVGETVNDPFYFVDVNDNIRTISDIQSGDRLFYNSTELGYTLTSEFIIQLNYITEP